MMKKGFTLSEILITLVVLGIIAALTIPMAYVNTKNRERMIGLQKAFSTIQKAMYVAHAEYGDMTAWKIPASGEYERAAAVAKYLLPELLTAKICGKHTGCFAPNTTYKYLNGSDWAILDERNDLYKFMMADGISVGIKYYPEANSQGFFVDVNSWEGPNVRGIDQFVFAIDTENTMIYPYGKDLSDDEINANCSKTGTGDYCATYIFRHNNVDYLR